MQIELVCGGISTIREGEVWCFIVLLGWSPLDIVELISNAVEPPKAAIYLLCSTQDTRV